MQGQHILDAIGNTSLMVATLIVDSGLRYLNTDVFRSPR